VAQFSEEFLFGRLSTPGGRAEEAREEALGLYDLACLEPLDPQPGEPVRLRFRCGADLGLTRLWVFWTPDGSPPTCTEADDPLSTTHRTAARVVETGWDTLVWGHVETWEAELPPQEEGTLLQYLAVGRDAAGRRVTCPQAPVGGKAPLRMRHGSPQVAAVGVDRLRPAEWLREAVLYSVFVDRFAPNPGDCFAHTEDLGTRLGGTLRGLTGRLEELCELGIDTLWLTPIFAAPDYHGYATGDFHRVEPALGGEEAWEELTREARRRELRLVLDFAANHVSDTHPAFVAARRSPDSPERSWFRFRSWPDDYEGFFGLPSMPILDAEQPALREHLIDAAVRWLRRGCAGFRLDHAHGLSHGFWSRFRAATRRAAPDSVCFGEVTHTPQFVRSFAGRLDGCLDFRLCELLRGAFGRGDLSLDVFDVQMRRHLVYSRDLVMPSFLDNHDMNRFLWLAGGDTRRLRTAALVQFLLPGPPVIYYGTEVGLSQRRGLGHLEEARLPMPERAEWDVGLRDFYRELIRVRRRVRPWEHTPEVVSVSEDGGAAVWRVGPVLVAANQAGSRTLSVPAGRVLLATDAGVEIRLGGVALPSWASAVIALGVTEKAASQ
jgi:glycosidase